METPDYRIDFEPRADYLIARVTGPRDSVEVTLAYFAEAAAATRTRGLHKLMIVEDLGSNVDPADLPQVATGIAPLVKGLIIAFTDTRPEHHAINRVGEALTVDAGAVVRMFREAAEAEKWIAAVP